jgi:predicted phage terminase large subunit-like protein
LNQTAALLQEELLIRDELDRRRSRENFLSFYMRMTGMFPPRHFRLIAALAEALESDQIDRAMLFAPPRHIKTLGISTLFPAWIMGRHPTTKIMSVVHTDRYAKKVGRNVRNLLRRQEWPFDVDAAPFESVELAGDTQAKEQWATPQGGEYNGFGMFGGNQHGNPAEWLFMDDVIKGRKIALSSHMRDEAWETYRADLLSRLQGRRKQVIAITRWHQDDPAGRILPDNYDGRSGWFDDRETGEPWYVLSLPAVAEHEDDPLGRKPGEWLWPEAFGEDQLGGVRRRGGWIWSALYQQRPSPAEGLMFTQEHINRYDRAKLDLTQMRIYISSDYAVTEEGAGDNPDWTVHQVWALDSERNLYLIDMWRGRTQPDVWLREWIRLVRKYKPLRAFEEAGQIIKSLGPLINTMMQDERVFVSRVQIASTTDKPSRAQALLGLASMGKMYLPHRAQVDGNLLIALDAFEKELLTFPGGTKDDCVDTATLMARGIDRMALGEKPRKRDLPQDDTLDDIWSREGR